MKRFNILEHQLVPEHYLVPKEEEAEILNKLGVSKEKLPKILRSDPVLKTLERIYGPIERGRLIKIVRNSETAGTIVIYRMVIE